MQSQQNQQRAITNAAADPERNFHGQLCATGEDGCAGDVRLYDWEAKGYGIVEPVLFTARSGATISGHVWATRHGPSKRPGIVITNGSVQAPEQLYWFAAQTLAKAGYVVLTSDPQGQGQSDGRGEAPDENEGFPAQTDGRPFFDGTRDALDFFLSTPTSVVQAAPELRDRHEPRAQAEPPRRRRPERRLQPVLEHAQPAEDRARRPLVRRRRRLLHRAEGPARRRDRRLGQPRAPEHERRPAGAAVPRRPRRATRTRRSRSRRSACRPTTASRRAPFTVGPGPARQEPGLARLLAGGRRHR